LVWAAIKLNSLISKDGYFDLRVIGVVHSALFLTAFWLFTPLVAGSRRWMRILLYGLMIFIFCDAMYACGLNSFYMDEPALIFVLMSAVLYLRVLRWHRRWDMAGLMIAALMVGTSKAQYSVLGFCIAALFIAKSRTLWPGGAARFVAAGVVLVGASGLMLVKGSPPEYAQLSVYNAVFLRLVPDSKDASLMLRELGLDDSYKSKIGMAAYSPGSGMNDREFVKAFGERISTGKLAVFYMKHPVDTWRTLKTSLAFAGNERSMGNFDESLGYGKGAQSQAFGIWSGFKHKMLAMKGARVFFTSLAVLALLIALLWIRRGELADGALAGGITLLAMATVEMGVSSLADAMDVERHHLIFFAIIDMSLIAIIWLLFTGGRMKSGGRATDSVASEQSERTLAW
jgi:hypothetical protein